MIKPGSSIFNAAATKPIPRREVILPIFSYDLEESSGTRYANYGPDLDTVTGTPGNETGVIGNGMTGNGSSQYVGSTDSGIGALVNGLTEFTISWWWHDSLSGGAFHIGSGVSDGIWLYPQNGGSYTRFYFYINGTTVFQVLEYHVETLMIYNDSSYHHWVWTFNGALGAGLKHQVWVDNINIIDNEDDLTGAGAIEVNSDAVTSVSGVGNQIRLGMQGAPWGDLDGGLDLFRMWPFAMTYDDVASEWNDGDGLI